MQLGDWSIDDVQDWLTNYGRALGDPDRFKPYMKSFRDNKICGKLLRGLDRIGLSQMGIDDEDCNDLYVGIRELNNIIAVTQDQLEKADTMREKKAQAKQDPEAAEPEAKEEEEDHWEVFTLFLFLFVCSSKCVSLFVE